MKAPLAAIFLWIGASACVFTDSATPLSIYADDSEVAVEAGVTTCYGNVQFDRGGLHLQADKAIVYRDNGNLVTTGNPVVFI